MIFLDELSPAYVYERPDGGKVYCWGQISDQPNLTFVMQQGDTDNKALNIQFNRTFTDGNTIKTWRAWAKFFNKYSSNAKYFTNIIAKERKS